MDTLNTVPSSGSFSSVVDVVNDNMSLITDAISQLELNTDKFVGLFSSSSDLPTTGVSDGMWGAVLGSGGFPAAIYEYNGSAWSDSGKTWEPDSAATAAVEEAKDEALQEIEDESTRIISKTTTLLSFQPDAGENPSECALLIKPDVVMITVNGVISDGTNPIANKTVTIGLWSTTTNANGEYSGLQIAVGKWTVSCQNYYDGEVEFLETGTKNITLTEVPTYAVKIHLVGSTYGDAMPNTVITCDSGETATTDEYGCASFSAIHEGEHTFTVNETGKEGSRTFMVWDSPNMTKKCMECTGDDVYEDTDVILSANSEDSELECYNVALYNAITGAVSSLANANQRITLASAKAASATVSFYNNTNITDATQLKFFPLFKFTGANALRGMTNLNRIVLTGQFGNGGSSCTATFYGNGTVTYFSLWKAKVYGCIRSSGSTWRGSTAITHFVTNPNMPYLKYMQDWGGFLDLDDIQTSATSLVSLQQFFQDSAVPATLRLGKDFVMDNVTTFNSAFTKSQNLVSMYIDGEIDLSKVTSFSNWIGTSGYVAAKLKNVSKGFKNVSANISFASSNQLTKASIENIITWLKVYEANSGTKTITFHATAKAAYGATDLANDLAAVGWTLA